MAKHSFTKKELIATLSSVVSDLRVEPAMSYEEVAAKNKITVARLKTWVRNLKKRGIELPADPMRRGAYSIVAESLKDPQ